MGKTYRDIVSGFEGVVYTHARSLPISAADMERLLAEMVKLPAVPGLGIPDGVMTIGEFAFVDENGWERMLLEDEDYDAPLLELLTISDSKRQIETYALYNQVDS